MKPLIKKNRRSGKERRTGKDRRKSDDSKPRFLETDTIQEQRPMKSSIKLIVDPNWDEIERVRNESNGFLKSYGLSDDIVHAITMVISELIENGLKYGVFKSPENRVIVDVYIGESIITVEVTNPVDESTYHHLRRLDKAIQWIRGYQDPFEAYTERLKEVAKKALHDKESGLGLVRIAYEGKAILDFFVGEDNILNVSAVSNLEGAFRR
ncbi:MAG: ATP-binding protein [Deltaproteobacteria bacterium]|nr:ATP-binding protein [Deltaproteobacteria bacterium]MBW2104918.1 ATP-binding protein [Deltaproteobacteria bacterium]MBW2310702.1 ATP-binding protein [Deltaproteobacteria bacterium]